MPHTQAPMTLTIYEKLRLTCVRRNIHLKLGESQSKPNSPVHPTLLNVEEPHLPRKAALDVRVRTLLIKAKHPKFCRDHPHESGKSDSKPKSHFNPARLNVKELKPPARSSARQARVDNSHIKPDNPLQSQKFFSPNHVKRLTSREKLRSTCVCQDHSQQTLTIEPKVFCTQPCKYLTSREKLRSTCARAAWPIFSASCGCRSRSAIAAANASGVGGHRKPWREEKVLSDFGYDRDRTLKNDDTLPSDGASPKSFQLWCCSFLWRLQTRR